MYESISIFLLLFFKNNYKDNFLFYFFQNGKLYNNHLNLYFLVLLKTFSKYQENLQLQFIIVL